MLPIVGCVREHLTGLWARNETNLRMNWSDLRLDLRLRITEYMNLTSPSPSEDFNESLRPNRFRGPFAGGELTSSLMFSPLPILCSLLITRPGPAPREL